MSSLSATDIQTLITAGQIIEAGNLLAVQGANIPSDVRQTLEAEQARLWEEASALLADAKELEQMGNMAEAMEMYQKISVFACDLPGIQDHIKRMDEVLALTNAVQRNKKRLREHAAPTTHAKTLRILSPYLIAGVMSVGIVTGLWFVLTTNPPSPPQHDTTPIATPAPASPAQNMQNMHGVSAPTTSATTDSANTSEATNQVNISEKEAIPDDSLEQQVSSPSSSTTLPRVLPLEIVYTVQVGDSLCLIANRLFCNKDAWRLIRRQNREKITEPNLLRPGVQLHMTNIKSLCPPP